MSEPEIKILKMTRVQGGHPVKGYVDVQIGLWVIYNWRIVQGPGEPIQVSYPLVSYRDKGGVYRYRSLLSLPSQLKQSIDLQILMAWKLEDQRGTNSTASDNQ
jgi:hypothetical protein